MAANTLTDGRAMTAQEVSRIAAAPAGQYGALSTVGGAVTVSAGMTLNVAAVAANTVTINGTVAATAYAGSTVTISASDPTNPRRDAITYDSAGAVAVTAGTPAAVTATTGPVLPTITASQYLLAEVYVGAGVTSITSGNIVDRRQVTALFGVSGSTIASAAALPITNQVHHVSGTTTITSLPTWPSGAVVVLTFDGACPITHNATSLILIGGASITTAAGDTLVFVSEGSGNWRQIVSANTNVAQPEYIQPFVPSVGASLGTGTLTANAVYLMPITPVTTNLTLANALVRVSVQSGNYDIGVYSTTDNSTFTRVASIGSTAVPAAATRVAQALTVNFVKGTRYYWALAADNATASFGTYNANTGITNDVGKNNATGWTKATSFPLPSSLTGMSANTNSMPLLYGQTTTGLAI